MLGQQLMACGTLAGSNALVPAGAHFSLNLPVHRALCSKLCAVKGITAPVSGQFRLGAVASDAVAESSENALLLSYYAAQNKSLFAAQCFVETVLDCYTRGENVDSLQTALQLRNMQQNGELLDFNEQDILLSWVIMVMLTAMEVGVALSSGEQQKQQHAGPVGKSSNSTQPGISSESSASITQQYSAQVQGLLQLVKQALKLYFDEGYSLQQLQSLQATVSSDPGQGMSQFAQLMQLYTRLVFITLEVVASSRLTTKRKLDNPASLKAPSGYTAAFQGGSSNTGLVSSAAIAAGRGGNRALAVQLITAFVGAAIGSAYCMRAFVLLTLEAYSAGVSVPEIFQQLQPQEFLQTGGLVPAQQQPQALQEINQQLFGRWLSLVYTAAAQLNAVFPNAAEKPGWAWYGGEDEVQANAMANFVAQTLLRLQTAEASASATGADADKVSEDPLISRIRSTAEGAAALDEASKQLQQEYQERGTLRGKAVPVMVRVADPELESTSGAVLVWKQQVDLVQAVYEYMVKLQAVG